MESAAADKREQWKVDIDQGGQKQQRQQHGHHRPGDDSVRKQGAEPVRGFGPDIESATRNNGVQNHHGQQCTHPQFLPNERRHEFRAGLREEAADIMPFAKAHAGPAAGRKSLRVKREVDVFRWIHGHRVYAIPPHGILQDQPDQTVCHPEKVKKQIAYLLPAKNHHDPARKQQQQGGRDVRLAKDNARP